MECFSFDTFDPAQAASSHTDYSQPIPAGTYNCRISLAEHGENNFQNGTQLTVGFEIMEGPHSGRQFRQWFRTSSTDPDKQDWVADDKAFMGVLFMAVLGGRGKPQDLLGKNVMVRVGIRKKKNGTTDNQAKGFKSIGNQVAPQMHATHATPTPAPQHVAHVTDVAHVAPSSGPQLQQPWMTKPQAPNAPAVTVRADDVPF